MPESLAVLDQFHQCDRILDACQLSNFSLVAEKIACCVQVVPLFLRFAAFEAFFVSVSPLVFLTLTFSSSPAVSPLFRFLICLLLALLFPACFWPCITLFWTSITLFSSFSRVTSALVCFFLPSRCFVRDFPVWCVPPAPCCGSLQRRGLPVVSPALLCSTPPRRSRWSGASALPQLVLLTPRKRSGIPYHGVPPVFQHRCVVLHPRVSLFVTSLAENCVCSPLLHVLSVSHAAT